MNEARFHVVLSGEVVEGANREQVIAAMAERYRLDRAQAASMLSGRPSYVKKDVDVAIAKRLVGSLLQMGALARIQPAGAAATPNPAATGEHPLSLTQPPRPASPAPARAAAPTPVPVAAAAPGRAAPAVAPDPRGWRFTIDGAPDFAFVTVDIPADETLKVEASAMATMDTNIRMQTRLGGGLSRFVTGESIFINEFTAEGGPGRIGIAPGAPGDIRHLYLANQTVYLQNSGYLASTTGVLIESKWQGLAKGFFSGESLFLIRASGEGDLWFSSYGGILEIDVRGDYVVDTGNIVAFTDGLQYQVTKVGGYKSLFFSGEGFVCRFSGQGKVWVQTRKANAFVAWAWPFRPVQKRN